MAITKIQSESLNLADDFAFTGTITGAGGNMKPAFFAYLSSSQTISDQTTTKANINTEVLDTDNAYDNATNYRFTPQVAGKYYFYAMNRMKGASSPQSSKIISCGLNFYKNGSYYLGTSSEFQDNLTRSPNLFIHSVIDMNGSTDYVEVYCAADHVDNANVSIISCHFGGYKIIE
jgi:hypothetical protein